MQKTGRKFPGLQCGKRFALAIPVVTCGCGVVTGHNITATNQLAIPVVTCGCGVVTGHNITATNQLAIPVVTCGCGVVTGHNITATNQLAIPVVTCGCGVVTGHNITATNQLAIPVVTCGCGVVTGHNITATNQLAIPVVTCGCGVVTGHNITATNQLAIPVVTCARSASSDGTPSVHPRLRPRVPAGPAATRSSVAMEDVTSGSNSKNSWEQQATPGVRTYTCDHCGKTHPHPHRVPRVPMRYKQLRSKGKIAVLKRALGYTGNTA
ncbi:hypothetical protein O3P69_019512 [Scylla paramamosain]|uniref:Uncharacterized protein n=1 Tax=Scylla paramamosain TaxID=85552 RepID=A0AAW0SWV1_SCYPA